MSFLLDKINIALLIVLFLNTFLCIYILINNPKRKINLIYAYNVFAIAWWVVSMFLYRSANQEYAMITCISLYAAATVASSTYLYFTYILPKEEPNIRIKVLLIFLINAIIVFMVINPGLIIKEVNLRPGSEKEIIFTKYYLFYFIYIIAYVGFGNIRLFLKYLKLTGIEKKQVLYYLLGFSIVSGIACVTNLTLPWLGYFYFNWVGQLFTGLFAFLISYAIIKYRFMDIRLVAREMFINLTISLFAIGLFYSIIWFSVFLFGDLYHYKSLILNYILILIAIYLLHKLNLVLRYFANKYFFFSLYNYQETIKNLTEKLIYIIDPSKIAQLIIETIQNTMQLDNVALLSYCDNKKGFLPLKSIGYKSTDLKSIANNQYLIEYLESVCKPLVQEELYEQIHEHNIIINNIDYKKNLSGIYKQFKDNNISLILPLISNKKLNGLIVLGNKISGEGYTEQDIDLLYTLANQAGLAIENATLYKRIQDWNKILQSKVIEKTSKLKKQAQKLEKVNEKLRIFDKEKDDFLSVASHELRTPMTAIQGFSEFLLSGKFGNLTDQQKDFISRIFKNTKDLIALVNDILDISKLESGRVQFEYEEIDIDKFIKDLLEEFQFKCNEKNIKLEYLNPENIQDKLWSDHQKLREVFINLLGNSFKFTPNDGLITVTIKRHHHKLEGYQFEVKDNGVGIPKEKMELVFEKFQQVDNYLQKSYTGTGLGLSIVKKIIEAFGGKIWVESEEGKGANFIFLHPKNVRNKSKTKNSHH